MESPVRGKAFCSNHCALIEQEAKDVPTGLLEFLEYCSGVQHGRISYYNFILQLYFYISYTLVPMMLRAYAFICKCL